MRIAPPLSRVNMLVFICLAILTFIMVRDRLAARQTDKFAADELMEKNPSLQSIVMQFHPRHIREITNGQLMSPLDAMHNLVPLEQPHKERLKSYPTISKEVVHANP